LPIFVSSLFTDLRLQGLIAIGTLENDTIYLEILEADIFFDSLEVRKIRASSGIET
jgi:hypothetical protein